MKTIRNLLFACAGGAALFALASCETESSDSFRVRRAVDSPIERNSASGEMDNLASMSGIPLAEVDFPNSRNQQPQIHTIADIFLHPPAAAATTTPPTTTTPPSTGTHIGEPTTQPQEPATRPGVRIDPLLGPRE